MDIAIGSFQNDVMLLYWVRDWLKLAALTGEEAIFTIGSLIQYCENQMLSAERERCGYAHTGVKNEGRHLSGSWPRSGHAPSASARGAKARRARPSTVG